MVGDYRLGKVQGSVLKNPRDRQSVAHDFFQHHGFGLPAIENGFGDVRGEEGEFEKASVPKLVAMSIGTYRSIDRNVEHV